MSWQPAPLVLAAAALATWRFAHGYVRLRRRGRIDHAGWGRPALFAAGLACAVLPLVSPLDGVGDDYLLSAHMLQHVLVGDVSPVLLLLAVRGPLMAFVLPVGVGRLLARVERLPVWASLVAWAAVIGAWHVPAAYDYALAHPLVHDFEHMTFAAIGFFVWTQLLDPARRRRLSTGQKLAFAGCLFALGQLLSDVLFFAQPLYAPYAAQPERLLGLTPAADQQLAGLVMMVEQTVVLGLYACFLVGAMLRRSTPRRATLRSATA